jgi:hypothetical protein
MSEAMQKAVDNLNAAFDLDVRLPITDVDAVTLADIAEWRGREDVAACLRDALRLETDVARQSVCCCNISLDCLASTDR